MASSQTETATLGGGCFWCIEGIFRQLKGVVGAVSGFTGGHVPGRPTYAEVSSGRTGHMEVVQLRFRRRDLSYEELLRLFLHMHDPTIPPEKNSYLGSQYRSAIFYHNEQQRTIAQSVLKGMAPHFERPITTLLRPLTLFFEAEEAHQDYFGKNTDAPYCKRNIAPKLNALKSAHTELFR
ncbi:peptide-methionine (S)-S-oxide reductase MsrA [Maribacter sp. 2307ULW6-5]|uniref:peptide-methionine (S)-S-oxide reductase MsrA n=1 Tax=Maribacter sp. 2307ULW6-5 TaxID=3386275 RepID=UPI0039BC42A0